MKQAALIDNVVIAPVMGRVWAMPSPATFSIPPISELLDRWLAGCDIIVDPGAKE